jgi:hypothetical protein
MYDRGRSWVASNDETMDESGEQCTVVFALIVTKSASECVCGCGGGNMIYTPSPPPPTSPTRRFRNNLYKDDMLYAICGKK